MILEQLKSIKRYKLEQAEQAMQMARSKVNTSKKQLVQAEQALVDYVQWRIVEEDKLFEEAREHFLSAKGVDDMRHTIGTLRGKDAFLEERILDAKQRIDQAIEEQHRCHRALLTSQKVYEKYDMLVIQENKKQQKAQEAKEETELDEFVISSYLERKK